MTKIPLNFSTVIGVGSVTHCLGCIYMVSDIATLSDKLKVVGLTCRSLFEVGFYVRKVFIYVVLFVFQFYSSVIGVYQSAITKVKCVTCKQFCSFILGNVQKFDHGVENSSFEFLDPTLNV